MASVSRDRGGFRIRFYDGNGDRKQIRVSGINKSTADKIARHVAALNTAKIANDAGAIDRQTALWLADVGQTIHEKLAAVGLVEPRESSSLGLFLRSYLERRADVKPATLRKWQSAVNHLIEHFGDDRDLRSINAGHADEFRSFLYHQKHSERTPSGDTVDLRSNFSGRHIDGS